MVPNNLAIVCESETQIELKATTEHGDFTHKQTITYANSAFDKCAKLKRATKFKLRH